MSKFRKILKNRIIPVMIWIVAPILVVCLAFFISTTFYTDSSVESYTIVDEPAPGAASPKATVSKEIVDEFFENVQTIGEITIFEDENAEEEIVFDEAGNPVSTGSVEYAVYTYDEEQDIYSLADYFESSMELGYMNIVIRNAPKQFIIAAADIFIAQPENFDVSVEVGRTNYEDCYMVILKYMHSEEERRQMWEELNRIADEIVADAPDYATPAMRVLYAHDMICRLGDTKTGYDWIETHSGAEINVYTLFTDGRSVCRGYAQAFSLLLDKFGIENYVVVSDSTDHGVAHVWNCYVIDGEIYYADVVWDDIFYDENGEMLDNSHQSGKWTYFHKSGEEFLESHTFSEYSPAVVE